ncbi:phenylalanine--tRNA ligase subunit beta [Bermanella marisrubri]|uniref:Phenylalanine--tRNA ligase beta subunit n=1 Tax=Bermanella marisrubri TaxID=207949 RepID=Q1N602_9GAMM|nr:phenylalanine--tRNA ligase subunit beta [Bermanella marisrubri]EAT13790.1 phenylalanyl-tRNA synthetase beta subunit [Oceanobacter sp. RED65] [Bermanella marisrubri]QIZ84560.1 phenylalanine--tRNA ligase subunit beta [Bermanella marisrubri]
MKFSENWLREWVNPKLSTDELVAQITMAGLEVDAVEPVAGEFSGVVVGEVVKKEQHPDADKLALCVVSDGSETFQVVCGAPNVREGLKIPFAKIGALLPPGKDGKPFKIKKAKLRGVESQGMLCAEAELQLSDAYEGLMELPADAPVGQDFREYLGLNDSIIEVDLTPNRADCLSLKGLAREVGTLNNEDVCEPKIEAVSASIQDTFKVTLEDAESCPKYLGRVIKGVDVSAQTPLWMVERLRRSGIRSIDPIVDVTNYVLLEQGQPMHGFDLAKLNGQIHVRKAKQDEKLTLLDGQEVKLDDDTLVIADDQKALAIAGVMGGEDSGVNSDTQYIFLEVAYFNPIAIAGKARKYGLHTDSSHRFERGVDFELQAPAMERATQLILEICGGEAGPVVESIEQTAMPASASIDLRADRVKEILALELPAEQIEEMLTRLGMKVSSTDAGWKVDAPSYRFDMAIEADLIEEIARIYGYNKLPVNTPSAAIGLQVQEEVQTPVEVIKQLWVDLGYQEAITYSFVDPKIQKLVDPSIDALALANPISADMGVMRSTLWVGLIKAAEHNLNRQQDTVRLFETGLRFVPQANGELEQTPMISGILCGQQVSKGWTNPSAKVDFYDLKGDVEAMLGLNGASDIRFERGEHSALHPGQAAKVVKNGKDIGLLGALHPELQKQLGIKTPLFVFELDLNAVSEGVLPHFAPLSKYPEVSRDLAFVVEESVTWSQVEDIIREKAGDKLINVTLFDVYRGQGIENGRKSLALGLTWQDASRTLNDEEITSWVNDIVQSLAEGLDAQLRG